MDRISRVLSDDSGFILRGGWAVAFLVFMFLMAILGQIPWEGFGAILLVSIVLTGLGALFSRPARASFVSPERPTPHEAVRTREIAVSDRGVAAVECLGCAAIWELDEMEAQRPSFTCPDCGRLMDSGRFVAQQPVNAIQTQPPAAASQREGIPGRTPYETPASTRIIIWLLVFVILGLFVAILGQLQ